MHPVVARVTERIVQRSADTRGAYLAGVDAMIARKPAQDRMGCANLAHAYAALPGSDKFKVTVEKAPNIGIVTAYNDMLSAHQPYQSYPAVLRDEAAKLGATVQVAGGVPAMCDGVTQGTPGMELSLFSRDAIAMATAVALSHDVFDGALLLGVCDKIVPGLLIGALHYGHLPCVFVPAGPMGTGLSNKDKAKVREQYAQGLVGRDELLKAESAAYHSPGTCTFYGTANSNQMLLEAMGLHVPGAAFEAPGTEAREAFTRQALRTVLDIGKRGNRFTPIGKLVDERCIVNAMVALLATGGSTNHLIHWVAIARSAGILIDWTDFDELSSVVPLLARVYPNGDADVNQFQAAGGPAWILRELLAGGFMHADVMSVNAGGIAAHHLALKVHRRTVAQHGKQLAASLVRRRRQRRGQRHALRGPVARVGEGRPRADSVRGHGSQLLGRLPEALRIPDGPPAEFLAHRALDEIRVVCQGACLLLQRSLHLAQLADFLPELAFAPQHAHQVGPVLGPLVADGHPAKGNERGDQDGFPKSESHSAGPLRTGACRGRRAPQRFLGGGGASFFRRSSGGSARTSSCFARS